MANLSYRLARWNFTAASLTTSSSAIWAMLAGSAKGLACSNGRQRAMRTSRSRTVRLGALGPVSVRSAGVGAGVPEEQLGPAQPDLVAGAKHLLARQALAVDEGAVGRAQVTQAERGAVGLDDRMDVGHQAVVAQRHVVLLAAPDRDAVPVQREQLGQAGSSDLDVGGHRRP